MNSDTRIQNHFTLDHIVMMRNNLTAEPHPKNLIKNRVKLQSKDPYLENEFSTKYKKSNYLYHTHVQCLCHSVDSNRNKTAMVLKLVVADFRMQ